MSLNSHDRSMIHEKLYESSWILERASTNLNKMYLFSCITQCQITQKCNLTESSNSFPVIQALKYEIGAKEKESKDHLLSLCSLQPGLGGVGRSILLRHTQITLLSSST